MEKFLFFMIVTAAIAFAGCNKDSGETSEAIPALSVGSASITATVAADTYPINVTCNVAWTATVSSGATWCTLSSASGTGNGTVTVNVMENTGETTRTATVTVAAGTLTRTVSVTQAGTAPALSVSLASITATVAADAYPVNVTCNVAWTATVSSGATWCTLSSTSGTGNGSFTVNITENTTTITRATTVTVIAGILEEAISVTQDARVGTPPNAASTQTWTFEGSNLIWSAPIQISECNKDDFSDSSTEPRCRSYLHNGTTLYYYYNWPYVNTNKATMCPEPWRVPNKTDFDELIAHTTKETLRQLWTPTGFVEGSKTPDGIGNNGRMWSATDVPESANAYRLWFDTAKIEIAASGKRYALEVRCVR
jgi:hypothetical protein